MTTSNEQLLREAIADALYRKGYEDCQKERDYDPRACDEWQRCVDALSQPTAASGTPADDLPGMWHISDLLGGATDCECKPAEASQGQTTP